MQSRNQRITPGAAKQTRPAGGAGRGRNQRIGAPAARKSPTTVPQQNLSKDDEKEKEQPQPQQKQKKGWGASNPAQQQLLALAPTSTSNSSDAPAIAPLFAPVYTETSPFKRTIMLGSGFILLKDRIPLSLQREIVNNCIDFGDGKIPQVGGFFDGKLTTDKGFYDVELPSEEEKKEEEEDGGGGKKKLNMISKARITVPIEHYPKKFTDFALQCVKEAQDFIAAHLEEEALKEAAEEESSVVGLDDPKSSSNSKKTPPQTPEEILPTPDPKFLLLNYYAKRGKIGWHYDRVPSLPANQQYTVRSPIISLSVGDSAEFLYKKGWNDPTESVLLESGDVLIFGGDSRMIYHMVPSINLGTTPKALNMRHFPGRFNITLRQE